MPKLEPVSAELLKPFGALIKAPKIVGVRNLYTEWLGSAREGATPRLHINLVAPSTLPYDVSMLERHPYSAQIFVPLAVGRYVIVVAESLPDGSPDLAQLRAFQAPGNVGVVYAPGVWHAGATVLGGEGSFAVLMWRNDTTDDDELLSLSAPVRISS